MKRIEIRVNITTALSRPEATAVKQAAKAAGQAPAAYVRGVLRREHLPEIERLEAIDRDAAAKEPEKLRTAARAAAEAIIKSGTGAGKTAVLGVLVTEELEKLNREQK